MCQPADGATTMRLKQATSKLALAAWMLVSALLVIGAAAGGRAYAQSGLDLRFLAPFRSFEIGDYPRSVVVGDVNGDGRPDVIVGGELSNSVSAFLATEDGSFTKGQDLDAGSTRYAIHLADLNHDGRLDLVVANSGSSSVSILIGRGDGTFLPRVAYAVGTDPGSVAVADFNGDGVPDLVTANRATKTLSVLLGRGDGTFGSRREIPTIHIPVFITTADLNSDGIEDLVVGNVDPTQVEYSSLSIFLSHGDGTFGPETVLSFSRPSQPPGFERVITVADLNGDGKPDIVLGSSSLSILPGRGDGTFGDRVVLATDPLGYASIVVGDINNDGVPDVVAATTAGDAIGWLGPNTVKVMLGRGDGTLGPEMDAFTAPDPWIVAIADMDLDGRADIVTANGTSRSFCVLHGNGDGTFGTDRTFPATPYPVSIGAGDLNRDGHLDVVTTSGHPDAVSVLLGSGGGTLKPAFNVVAGPNPKLAAVSDLNADGILDLLVTTLQDESDGSIGILLGKGDGTFKPARYFTTASGTRPGSVAVGDFNGDMKPDLAVSNNGYFATSISILLGKGDGTFAEATHVPGRTFTSAAIGDFNRDGKADLAFTSGGSTASIMLGRGDGTFGPIVDFAVGGYSQSVGIYDLNRDGNPDLIVGGDSISVLLGKGDGTFQPTKEYEAGLEPVRVSAADVNGDGILDIVAAAYSNTVSVLLGRGDGSFEPAVDFGARGFPMFVIGDLDEDGRPDIAVANTGGGVSLLLNRTPYLSVPLRARAYVRGEHRIIRLDDGPSRTCVRFAPVDASYNNSDVDLSTIRLVSQGTGSVSEIAPVRSKQVVADDEDRHGVTELSVYFARSDLVQLFSLIRGRKRVDIALEGRLYSQRKFRATLQVTVVGSSEDEDQRNVAQVSPNPLNPQGTLRFTTLRSGEVSARLFDVTGRLVRTIARSEHFEPGKHAVVIDGRDDRGAALATGVYFYRMETPEGTNEGRVVIAK